MARPDPVASALIQTAFELHRRKLWLEVPSDSPFMVRVPGEEHPLVATIMGHAGDDYGLLFTSGERALQDMMKMASGGINNPEAAHALALSSCSMIPLSKIVANMRSVLTAAGFQGRRESIAPFFVFKESHGDPRAPRKSEQRLMTACMRAVIAAHEAGELRVDAPDPKRKRILEITVEGEGDARRTTTRTAKWPKLSAEEEAMWPALDRYAEIGPTPKDAEWLVGLVTAPSVHAPNGSALALSFVAQREPREMLSAEPVKAGDFSTVAEQLEIALDYGHPKLIVFTNPKMHAALAPNLIAQGIHIDLDPEHPDMVGLLELMGTELAENASHAAWLAPDAAMPSTLEEWKQADFAMTMRLSEESLAAGGLSKRAIERYFGSMDLADEVMEELDDLQPLPCVLEWMYVDYRAKSKSATFLEKRLKKRSTTPVERALIEARIDARLSIYRVVSTQPGECLEVEDVFDGARFTVHDAALSGCDVDGTFLPARIQRLGKWNFSLLAGPPIPPIAIQYALMLFEELGVELSAAGLQRSSHVMGALWELALPRSRPDIEITNSDGDELVLTTATFQVADASALVRALGKRKDMKYEENEGAWVWWRKGGPMGGPAGGDEHTVVGRMEMMDDRLVLEVDSAERLEHARIWLEALPGVRFERATQRDWKDEESPLDDELPVRQEPLSPEAQRDADEWLRKQAFEWLDQPVPALRNRTPRQACKTKDGRRAVAILIRTMPDVGGSGGTWVPPREELLKELGLGNSRTGSASAE